MAISDVTLFERWIRTRDADAFAEIVTRHSAMVYGTCKRVLGNPSDAEDISQECFVELARRGKTIRPSLAGWLHTVATRRSLDRIKAERRRKRREARFAETLGTNSQIEWDDIQAHIDKAIAALPVKLREPIIHRFLEGQTHEAIAGKLGVSRSTVQYRLGKGIEEIRRFLKRRGVVAPTAILAPLLTTNLTVEAAPATLTMTLGKLALASAAGAAGSAAGTSATSIAALGGALIMKKVIVGVAVILVGGIGLWALKQNQKPELAQPARELNVTRLEDSGPEAYTPEQHVPVLSETPREDAVEAALAPEGAAITGRVLEAETGEPIFDVEICLQPDNERLDRRLSTKTDKEGRYRFEGLPRGTYSVSRAWGSPRLPKPKKDELQLVSVEEDQFVDGVDFHVVMGLRVAGKVVDSEGIPVAGAGVEGRDRNDYRSLETYTTGTDGAFELLGFTQTDKLTLEAEKGDELACEQYGPVSLGKKGLSGVVLTLYPTASISGRIVNARGRPITNVLVNPSAKTEHQRLLGRGTARTAQDGCFKVEGLAAGTYELLLLREGTHTYKRPVSPQDEIELAHGEKVNGLTLVLEEDLGLTISGSVASEAGDPIEGAEIRGRPSGYTRSDKNGQYIIPDLDEGLYTVVVKHKKYAMATVEDVPAGIEGLDFTLLPRGAIEGRVIDAIAGRPVPEFQILHIDDYNRGFVGIRRRFQRRRDEAGRFRVEAVEPGPATVIAKAPGYAECSTEVPYVGAGESLHGVEIRLRGGASVKGVVLDTAGNPITNAGVIPGEIPQHEHPEAAVVTRTDLEGGFYVTDLSPDLAAISAYHPHYAVASVPVALEASRESVVTIVLPKGGIVEGTVYYDGQPWPGQEVRLRAGRADGGGIPTAAVVVTTTEHGTYRFEQVKPGNAVVMLWARNGFSQGTQRRRFKSRLLTQVVTVADGETTESDFHIGPACADVEGLVTLDGEPVAEADVGLFVASGYGQEQLSTKTGIDGWYQFEGVPAGPASIVVLNPFTDSSRRVEFEIGEDQMLRQDVELSGGTFIVGQVRGLRVGEQARVTAFNGHIEVIGDNLVETMQANAALAVAGITVDGNGGYKLGAFEAGRYTVIAYVASPSSAGGRQEFTITRFVTCRVELTGESTYDLDLVFD